MRQYYTFPFFIKNVKKFFYAFRKKLFWLRFYLEKVIDKVNANLYNCFKRFFFI